MTNRDRRIMRTLTILLAALALGACVSGVTASEQELLVGHYSQGFEVDAFRPCGSEEVWWVTEGEELRDRYRALAPAQYEEVYVEVRGSAGPASRAVNRVAADGDCR